MSNWSNWQLYRGFDPYAIGPTVAKELGLELFWSTYKTDVERGQDLQDRSAK